MPFGGAGQYDSNIDEDELIRKLSEMQSAVDGQNLERDWYYMPEPEEVSQPSVKRSCMPPAAAMRDAMPLPIATEMRALPAVTPAPTMMPRPSTLAQATMADHVPLAGMYAGRSLHGAPMHPLASDVSSLRHLSEANVLTAQAVMLPHAHAIQQPIGTWQRPFAPSPYFVSSGFGAPPPIPTSAPQALDAERASL